MIKSRSSPKKKPKPDGARRRGRKPRCLPLRRCRSSRQDRRHRHEAPGVDRGARAVCEGDRGRQGPHVDRRVLPSRTRGPVLRKVVERNQGPLRNEEWCGCSASSCPPVSRRRSRSRSGYLGPEGTFTQSAVLKHSATRCTRCPCQGRRGVPRGQGGHRGLRRRSGRKLERGHRQHPHARHVSHLAAQSLRRDRAPDSSAPDGRMQDIGEVRRVCSHPQSLAQCKAWLRQNLPHAEIDAGFASNAEAARRARDEDGTAALWPATPRRRSTACGSCSAASRTGGRRRFRGGRPRAVSAERATTETSLLVSARRDGGRPRRAAAPARARSRATG